MILKIKRKLNTFPLLILGGSLCLICSCSGKSNSQTAENIVIVGHGGSGFETFFDQLPANTIKSFERALIEEDADGIEMDLQLTKDDVVIVFHDKILDNKTDCSGTPREFLFADIGTCDFHGDFSMFSKGKYQISSLEEVLEHFKRFQQKKYFYFNVKVGEGEDKDLYDQVMAKQLVTIINTNQMHQMVIVETPDIAILNNIAALDSNIIIMRDIGPFEKDFQSVMDNKLDGLVVEKSNITEEQVELAKKSGKRVVIYGVKTRAGILDAINKNPDVIQTDKIDLTKKLLD